eukprot:s3199_g2.t1
MISQAAQSDALRMLEKFGARLKARILPEVFLAPLRHHAHYTRAGFDCLIANLPNRAKAWSEWDVKEEATWDAKTETIWDDKQESTWDVKQTSTWDVKQESAWGVKQESTWDVKQESTWDVKKESTWDVKETTWDPKKETVWDVKQETTWDVKKEGTWDVTKETTWDVKKKSTWDVKKETTWNVKQEITWDEWKDWSDWKKDWQNWEPETLKTWPEEKVELDMDQEDDEDEPSQRIGHFAEMLERWKEKKEQLRQDMKKSPPPRQEPPYPPPKKGRTGRRSSLRSGPRRKGKKGGVDDSKTCAVDIRNLLYSQKSCKVGLPWAAGSGELGSFTSKRHWNFTKNSTGCWLLSMKDTFQCGRTVDQLVKDLETGKVDISAPFLRLTVFETRDEKSRKPELPLGP